MQNNPDVVKEYFEKEPALGSMRRNRLADRFLRWLWYRV